MPVQIAPNDAFRRFTPAPLGADLNVMGRRVRLETNNPVVLKRAQRAFARYGELPAGPPDFRWTLICDPSSGVAAPWPRGVAFSDEGIRFVNFDQRSFLAFDLANREAVGFISEEFTKDELGFLTPILSHIFDLSAAALGLTEIMAGCVALDGRGLLVLGPPRSGKTTAGYLAWKAGMEFHADQVTCVDLVLGSLRAWSQFWPPAFRRETVQFLPELASLTRPLAGCDFDLLCLADHRSAPVAAHSVTPAACVFLERCAAPSPQLTGLSVAEVAMRLADSLSLKEDICFEAQRSEVLRRLSELPAYHLAYPADPQTAATMFPDLLKSLA